MKRFTTDQDLDFNTFVKAMEKGYSGGGDNENFTLSTFGGKKLKTELSITQDLMLAYDNYVTAKQILTNQLKKEK